jgi:aerobic carbon-monoxide dehydrogenase medium subunit
VITSPFAYHRATSVEDALSKLAASNGAGKFIAGGHSLVPMMKMRLAQPSMLIDIARLPALSGIRDTGTTVEVGACTTHHEIATSALLHEHLPVLAEAAREIGDPQVRHRGTIGGSLAHADPAADLPAVIVALDAVLHVHGPQGARQINADDYFTDLFTVDLRPDEIIVAVSFPRARAAAYAKLHQRASHYAIVGVAARLDVQGGSIIGARVGVTGATTHAVRLRGVEVALAGKPATQETIAAAARSAGAELTEISADLHASADYRRAMVGVFAGRAMTKALARASA